MRHGTPRHTLPQTAACLVAALLLASCSTGAPNDTVGPGGAGPVDTDTYPNLNVVPRSATDQLVPSETESAKSALKGARVRGQAGGTIPPSAATEQARLRKIGAENPGQVLKAIEGEQ